MVAWLSHPNELGRVPSEIECTDEFDYEELRYYVLNLRNGNWENGLSVSVEDLKRKSSTMWSYI